MIPYKCPVYNGTGLVPSGFYNIPIQGVVSMSTTNCTETCRSCRGSGIIYGTSDVPRCPVIPEFPRPDPVLWDYITVRTDDVQSSTTGNQAITYDLTWDSSDGTIHDYTIFGVS